MKIPSVHQRGFGVIEIITAMALFTIIAVSGVVVVVGTFSTNRLGDEHTQATLYAAEGIEAAKSLKNQGWSNVLLGTNCTSGCGVSNSGGSWSWQGSTTTFGPFTRSIVVTPAQRGIGGALVVSGGTPDADVYRVESTVTWDFTPTRNNTVTQVNYLSNFRKSIVGNWGTPTRVTNFNLSAATTGNESADPAEIAYANNYLFILRDASGGTELLAVDVSSLGSPSICATCQREFGYSLNDIVISGNYAFIATDSDTAELVVIDISSPTALNSAATATFDLTNGNSGSTNANAEFLAIEGTNLYMARAGGNEFLKFNISTPLSPSLTGTNNGFVGTPTDMALHGTYAYLTSTDNATELQVFNLNTLNRDGIYNLNSGNQNADGTAVIAFGDSLLVGRATSAAPELYSFSLTSPTSPTLVSSIEIGNPIYELASAGTYIFVATDNAAQEFRVINGATVNPLPALPPLASINSNSIPTDMIYVTELDRIFFTATTNNPELDIFQPS